MYQLVSAVVQPIGGNARWRSMDISDVQLSVLFANFKKVMVVLSNVLLPEHVAFDLESIRATHGGDSLTILDFLMQNGNRSLDTTATLPTINTRYANYVDARHAGYKVSPVTASASLTSTVLPGDAPWLLMTRPNLDYKLLYEHALVNVNGFYHQTDYSADGVFVVDGMKSCLKSQRNEIGILSFLKLGKLSFYPIADDMIYKKSPDQVLKNNCYVDLGVDLSNKTVMLVLGGYLHLLNQQTFVRTSATSFSIDFSNLPLVERYYESCGVLDLSTLELETSSTNPNQISVANLFSDAVLRRYLTLSQTFFIAVGNTEMFIDYNDVTPSPFPGVYATSEQPIYPLLVGAGRHENYWYRSEYGRYSLQLTPASTWQGTRTSSTVLQKTLHSVDSSYRPVEGFYNANAKFLLIGSDL